MEEYKKILVPLDGLKVAEAILPELDKLAAGFKASISFFAGRVYAPFPGVDPTKA